MGYLTTPEEYDQGGYEAGATFFGRESSEPAMAIVRDLLGEIQ